MDMSNTARRQSASQVERPRQRNSVFTGRRTSDIEARTADIVQPDNHSDAIVKSDLHLQTENSASRTVERDITSTSTPIVVTRPQTPPVPAAHAENKIDIKTSSEVKVFRSEFSFNNSNSSSNRSQSTMPEKKHSGSKSKQRRKPSAGAEPATSSGGSSDATSDIGIDDVSSNANDIMDSNADDITSSNVDIEPLDKLNDNIELNVDSDVASTNVDSVSSSPNVNDHDDVTTSNSTSESSDVTVLSRRPTLNPEVGSGSRAQRLRKSIMARSMSSLTPLCKYEYM